MDILFFRKIKPYNRGGNIIKNAKRTYYFVIEFTRGVASSEVTGVKYNKLIHGVYYERILLLISLPFYTYP